MTTKGENMDCLIYEAEACTKTNSRKIGKPNEDCFVVDTKSGIYILLDGITRVHAEYDGTEKSAACDVNQIFSETVYDTLKTKLNDECVPKIIREAVLKGNSEIGKYRMKKSLNDWGFFPGTLGIIAVIRNNTLFYLSAGDCLGTLIRGNSKIFFGRQYEIKALEIKNVSKKERYELYCNHPENRFSYTVFNGDQSAADGMETSFIGLSKGDVVLMATDGAASVSKYEKANTLKEKSLEHLIHISSVYDQPPFATYADDKTIIRINCK